MDLVTHSRVVVARDAAAIWPHVLDAGSWKKSALLVHRAGPVGQVGEWFDGMSTSAPLTVEFRAQVVELVPNRRRTLKLVLPDGTLLGHATHTLEPHGASTTVSYDVTLVVPLPPQARTLDAAARVAMRRDEESANARRFDAELRDLKAIVEGTHRGPVVHEGYVVTPDSIRLYYRSVGRGTDVVLVNGANYARGAFDALASGGRRVVSYDIRGRGMTDSVPPGKLGIATADVADVEVMRRAIGAERLSLIGWSGGALSFFRYAIEHPERVSHLVLLTPVGPRWVPWWDDMRVRAAARADTAAANRIRAQVAAGAYAGDEPRLCRDQAEASLATNWVVTSRRLHAPDVCASPNEWESRYMDFVPRLLDHLGKYDWRSDLARVRARTLVVHGALDNPPLGGSREWAAGIPGARLLVIDGVGHWPHYEKPAETLGALNAFLAGGWPAGATVVPQTP